MAELKRNFLKGRMNKDLDERLVPNGEYRDALNIEISTSEGSNTGSVQNKRGNLKTTVNDHQGVAFMNDHANSDAITVGTFSDESTKKIYNLIHKASNIKADGVYGAYTRFTGVRSDVITEWTPSANSESGSTEPVVTDVYEVRTVPSTPMVDGYGIEGLETTTTYPYMPKGIRKGMRVQFFGPDGTDYLGPSNEVYVKNVYSSEFFNNGTVSITPITEGFFTQIMIDAGVVVKFSAPRILNFKSGTTEAESNTTGNPSSNTPENTMITGINLVDDILYYTDGRTEPKRISLKRFRHSSNIVTKHSLFRVSGTADFGPAVYPFKEKHITVLRPNPLTPPTIENKTTNRSPETIIVNGMSWDDDNGDPIQYSSAVHSLIARMPGLGDDFVPVNFALAGDDDILFTPGETFYIKAVSTERPHWKINDILEITGIVNAKTAKLEIISIPNSFQVFEVKLVEVEESYTGNETDESWMAVLTEKETLYPKRFLSFAYRYKYIDGEYSCISPYSKTVFKPSFYSFNALEGFNKGMENRTKSVTITDFVPANIPDDVVEVELLFKDNNDANIYSINNIIRDSSFWTAPGTGSHRGQVSITSEVFGRTLPSIQGLRPFDNVPRSAVSQEFSAGRLMFGNYVENYNLTTSGLDHIQPIHGHSIEQIEDTFVFSDYTSADYFNATSTVDEITAVDYSGLSPFIGNTSGLAPVSNYEPEADDLLGDNFEGTEFGTFPITNVGIKATNEDDSDNVYNQQTPQWYISDDDFKYKQGPFFTAQDDGTHVFKASVDMAFYRGDGPVPGGLGGNGFNLTQVAPCLCLVTCGPNGRLNFSTSSTTIGQQPWIAENFDSESYPGATVVNPNGPNIVHKGQQKWYSATNSGDLSSYKTLTLGEDENDEVSVELEAGQHYAFAVLFANGENTFGTVYYGGRQKNASIEMTDSPTFEYSVQVSPPAESVKSMRTYELGVVYLDGLGRESTVLIDDSVQLSNPKSKSQFKNKFNAKIYNSAPYWAKYYKFFVKEVANEYHNIVLYKAYPNDNGAQDFLEDGVFDLATAGSGTIMTWLAFNSADRNKVSKGDYLTLKKEHGSQTPVTDLNARWKAIDIVDSATVEEDDAGEQQLSVGSLDLDALGATFDDVNGKFFVKVFADAALESILGDPAELTDAEKVSNGALFEVEGKEVIDLDLFYEASQAYPIYLDKEDVEMYIKVGQKVEIDYYGIMNQASVDAAWEEEGFNPKVIGVEGASTFGYNQVTTLNNDALVEVTLSGSNPYPCFVSSLAPMRLKFINPDNSYVMAYVIKNWIGNDKVYLRPYTHNVPGLPTTTCSVGLSWFNCYAFGNGVESDRIRDDFNANVIYPYTETGKQSGFKATLQDKNYKEVRKPNDIIFSQIHNEATGLNSANEFIMADNIVKRLNPEYGSIQKLFVRGGMSGDSLLAFCEERVLSILTNKDALFNADGSAQLLTSNKVLGLAKPYSGNYGISKNPESFAVDEYRCYFTDKDRGAVLRLSKDGLTPISSSGMRDWFNDNLQYATACVGSYDGHKEEYNLTVHSITAPLSTKNVYTLTWNEAAKGWVSFKSFIKESGLSLSNNYYTFKAGKMYLHDTEDTTVAHNNFYAIQNTSTITPIFNENSDVVKSFFTINYEGTQSRVITNNSDTIDSSNGYFGEFYNNATGLDDGTTAIKGWYVEDVSTDMQEGQVDEFIDKENKWFNYIRGVDTTFTNAADAGSATGNLDFDESSIQGVGQLSINATSDVAVTAGYNIVVNVTNGDNWTSDGYVIYNQTVHPSSATFTLTPTVGNSISAANFSNPNTDLPSWIALPNNGSQAITFSDSGSANTPTNTVIGTFNFADPGSTLSSSQSITLTLNVSAAIPNIVSWTGQLLFLSNVSSFTTNAPQTVSINESDDVSLFLTSTSNTQQSFIASSNITAFAESELFTFTIDAGPAGYYEAANPPSLNISPNVEIENYSVVGPVFTESEYTSDNTTTYSQATWTISYVAGYENLTSIDDDNTITINTNWIKGVCKWNPEGSYYADDSPSTVVFNIDNTLGMPAVQAIDDATGVAATWITIDEVTVNNVELSFSENTGDARTATLKLFSSGNSTNVPDSTRLVYQSELQVCELKAQYVVGYNEIGWSWTDDGAIYEEIYSPEHDHLNGVSGQGPKLNNLSSVGDVHIRLNRTLNSGFIALTSDCVVNYLVGDPDWLTLSVQSNNNAANSTQLVYVAENTTAIERQAEIIFTHPDSMDQTDSVTLIQEAAYNSAVNTLTFKKNTGGTVGGTTTPNIVDAGTTINIPATSGAHTLWIDIPNADVPLSTMEFQDPIASISVDGFYTYETVDEPPSGYQWATGFDVSTASAMLWYNGGILMPYFTNQVAKYEFTFWAEENTELDDNGIPKDRSFAIFGFNPENNSVDYSLSDDGVNIVQLAPAYTQFAQGPEIIIGNEADDANNDYQINSNGGTPQVQVEAHSNGVSNEDGEIWVAGAPGWFNSLSIAQSDGGTSTAYFATLNLDSNTTPFQRKIKLSTYHSTLTMPAPSITSTSDQLVNGNDNLTVLIPGSDPYVTLNGASTYLWSETNFGVNSYQFFFPFGSSAASYGAGTITADQYGITYNGSQPTISVSYQEGSSSVVLNTTPSWLTNVGYTTVNGGGWSEQECIRFTLSANTTGDTRSFGITLTNSSGDGDPLVLNFHQY